MKLNREARWLIILTLMALLVVGGAGAVAAAGNQHGPAFRRIAAAIFGSNLRTRTGYAVFADFARHRLFDQERRGGRAGVGCQPG